MPADAKPLTAQALFDAALADEAVRAKLNRLAAESEGWREIADISADTAPVPTLVGRHVKYAGSMIPDYTRSLDAAASLKLPDGVRRESVFGGKFRYESIVSFPEPERITEFTRRVAHKWELDYTDPADEALARVCCAAIAKGWEI
jgi:hypothetical protein